MVLTVERHLGPDIWPKTPQQAKIMESIIRITWNTEAMQQQKASGKPNCPLVSTGKETRHVVYFCSVIIVSKIAYLGLDFGFNHGL